MNIQSISKENANANVTLSASELLGMLPPACTRSDCSQIGEPVSHRIAENGFEKPTYATFKKVEAGIWEYCGDCFRGENVCSGIELPYL